MKTLLVPLALIAVLVLAFGALTAACDGDDALTLEQFFQRMEEVSDEFLADRAPLEEELGEITDESSVDEALDLLRQDADLLEGFVDELDDLNDPDEAADLMDETVSAGRDLVRVVRDAIDDAEGAESMEEVFAILWSEEIGATAERFDQGCLDAEQLAADNGITVDLDCDEDE